jgi:hypothetical protein
MRSIQYSAAEEIEHRRHGILDRPLSPTMTAKPFIQSRHFEIGRLGNGSMLVQKSRLFKSLPTQFGRACWVE